MVWQETIGAHPQVVDGGSIVLAGFPECQAKILVRVSVRNLREGDGVVEGEGRGWYKGGNYLGAVW